MKLYFNLMYPLLLLAFHSITDVNGQACVDRGPGGVDDMLNTNFFSGQTVCK